MWEGLESLYHSSLIVNAGMTVFYPVLWRDDRFTGPMQLTRSAACALNTYPFVKQQLERVVTMSSTTYGYARVSSRDQNFARQLDALAAFGVSPQNVFADRASGRDFERPSWQLLMGALAADDVLVVKSIDRLGCNYDEILQKWHLITREMGAAIVVLDMPLLDTRTRADGITGAFISDLVLQILSYVAQVERENIKQRQAEGIAAAKARGVRFGRPQIERPQGYARARKLYLQGRITRARAADQLGVCVSTFDRWLRQDGQLL